jgi:anti-sigma28 factor (negative regulator of flagellin synthesis)
MGLQADKKNSMSKGSQKPVPSVDMSALEPQQTNTPETGTGKCLPAPSRAARVRAIHERVRANVYVVPAGLVAERMIEEAAGGKRPTED